jgi:pimeloyl-CoA synthetase
MFVWNFIKSLKDPDVLEASKLHIDIRHYKKYKEIENEIQQLYKENGLGEDSEKKAFEILKKAPNLNEWRRYSDYQFKKIHNEMRTSR